MASGHKTQVVSDAGGAMSGGLGMQMAGRKNEIVLQIVTRERNKVDAIAAGARWHKSMYVPFIQTDKENRTPSLSALQRSVQIDASS